MEVEDDARLVWNARCEQVLDEGPFHQGPAVTCQVVLKNTRDGQLSARTAVKFLNDVGSATVLRVEGEQVVVEDEDGFERTVGAGVDGPPDPEQEAKSYGDNVPDLAKLLVQEVGEKRMRSLQRNSR